MIWHSWIPTRGQKSKYFLQGKIDKSRFQVGNRTVSYHAEVVGIIVDNSFFSVQWYPCSGRSPLSGINVLLSISTLISRLYPMNFSTPESLRGANPRHHPVKFCCFLSFDSQYDSDDCVWCLDAVRSRKSFSRRYFFLRARLWCFSVTHVCWKTIQV